VVDRREVPQHTRLLARDRPLGKVEQATDALTILPGSVCGQEWARDDPGAGSDPLEDHRDPLANADAHGA
jgi:hypothetical protein